MPRDRLLVALSLAIAASYTGVGMMSAVRVLYAQSRGASPAIIGSMASAFLIANFVAQYPSGWLSDRWGRRPLLIASLIGQAATSLVYIVVRDPALFVSLAVVEGLAAAPVLPVARAMIADSVPVERQGKAYGVFGSAFNAGYLVGPPIGGALAGLSYAGVFISATLIRLLGAVVAISMPREGHHARHEVHDGAPPPLRALWRLPLAGAYVLAFGDLLWLGFELAVLPLWMHTQLAASVGLIGLSYAAFSLPTTLLSPVGGRLADRLPRTRLILLTGLAQVPLYLSYGLLSVAWPVLALFCLHGVIYSLMQPAVDAHLASASPPGARTRAQSIYGTSGLVGAFAGAAGSSLLYEVNPHLPLMALGLLYGACVLAGTAMIRAGRGLS